MKKVGHWETTRPIKHFFATIFNPDSHKGQEWVESEQVIDEEKTRESVRQFIDETISLVAGIFDWDNMNWDNYDDSIFQPDLFTPLAYTSGIISDLDTENYISLGGVSVPPNFWTPTRWNPMGEFPVPEPSIAILTILGACTMLLKRK